MNFSRFRRRGRRIKGSVLIEYVIILSMLSVMSVGLIYQLGTRLSNTFLGTESQIATSVSSALGDTASSPGGSGAVAGLNFSFVVDATPNPGWVTNIAGTAGNDTLTVSYTDIVNISFPSMTKTGDVNFILNGGTDTIVLSGFTQSPPPPSPNGFAGQVMIFGGGGGMVMIQLLNHDGMPGQMVTIDPGSGGTIDKIVLDDVVIPGSSL